jgi:hypothetical protein
MILVGGAVFDRAAVPIADQCRVGAWLDCVTIVRIMAKLRPFGTDCFNLTKVSRIFASFNVFARRHRCRQNPLHGAKND